MIALLLAFFGVATALNIPSVLSPGKLLPWFKFDRKECGGGKGCPAGRFCLTPPGNCSGTGVCSTAPPFCFAGSTATVCGCNGRTYESSCDARKEEVSVDSFGSCSGIRPTPIPVPRIIVAPPHAPKLVDHPKSECGPGLPSCGRDMFCSYPCSDTASSPAGGDGAPAPANGECVNVPNFCVDSYNPVCGCDSYTYENPCRAAQAHVHVASMGVCAGPAAAPPPDADEGVPCIPGIMPCSGSHSYCITPTGTCVVPSYPVPGVCTVANVSSPDCSKEEVCGCNGVTYTSDCAAWALGESVRYTGPCSNVPTMVTVPDEPPVMSGGVCDDNDDCPYGVPCVREDGMCDTLGVCRTRAELHCDSFDPNTVTEPVCGCDGRTYPSRCTAVMQGVTPVAPGVCQETTDDDDDDDGSCDDDTDCGADEFCNFDNAACGADPGIPGVCTTVPLSCPKFRGPVLRAAEKGRVEVDQVKGTMRLNAQQRKRQAAAQQHALGQKRIVPRFAAEGYCGCDNVTYVSPCYAHLSKMSVASPHPCSGWWIEEPIYF